MRFHTELRQNSGIQIANPENVTSSSHLESVFGDSFKSTNGYIATYYIANRSLAYP